MKIEEAAYTLDEMESLHNINGAFAKLGLPEEAGTFAPLRIAHSSSVTDFRSSAATHPEEVPSMM